MRVLGSVWLVDPNQIGFLEQTLINTPPPGGGLIAGTVLCLDLDETDDLLEFKFPNHCQKATVLCPPPEAMEKYIDGDQENFIRIYNEYLDHDEFVRELVSILLSFIKAGGNIMLYSPSYMDDASIWINTLTTFFYTRFGILIGMKIGESKFQASYDPSLAYACGLIDVYDYIESVPLDIPDPALAEKIYVDLSRYTEDPYSMYNELIQQYRQRGKLRRCMATIR